MRIWSGATTAVKFARVIREYFIKLHPSDLACLSIPFFDVKARFDLTATSTDLSSDLVDIVINVDAVSHSPLVAIFLHKVLMKKPTSDYRRRSQPDKVRVKDVGCCLKLSELCVRHQGVSELLELF